MRARAWAWLKRAVYNLGFWIMSFSGIHKVCIAGEDMCWIRLDPGESAIVDCRSYHERKMPKPGAVTPHNARQN